MDGTSPLPELGDAEYGTEVLQLPVDKSEVELDRELVARANALGLRATLPSVSGYKRNTSSAVSNSSESTSQERTFSTASDSSASTYITPHSSIFSPPSPGPAGPDAASKPSRNLSFSPYEKYLAQDGPTLDPSRSRKLSTPGDGSAQSIFSFSTRKTLSGIRGRMRLRKKPSRSFGPASSCLVCRTDFSKSTPLQNLPCGHAFCAGCLRTMVEQATMDETKMPPQCCMPVPAENIQAILETATQEGFLKAVVQFSTPWESRMFCSKASCGEFIPCRKHVDPSAPFAVTCRKCHTRVCSICKKDAHPVGKDCPKDWEVEMAPRVGKQPGCKRCYKCRGLVECRQGSTHLTCPCKAQFCSICGGVWDPAVGCPNICNSEDEIGRRRDSDEARTAQDSFGTAATTDNEAAEKRSARHPAIQGLQQEQDKAMRRFCGFMAKMKTSMEMRQLQQRISLAERETEQVEELKDKHAKATAQLEDRQITEEMELRSTLEQSERSIKARIKHMEAYCDGLGRHPSGPEMPPRVVTEQNLRDLGHQYNIRDDMERQHQARINMMRDRQSKRMEELLEHQAVELDELADRQRSDRDEIESTFTREGETINAVFEARQSRFTARWNLAIEVLCKELEDKDGVQYALVLAPSWPGTGGKDDGEYTVT
ncbi:putative E3 ubiquitin-protein ligase ARI8 [Tolypocladium ophioglossoides CBS 100239]|uniref:RBR-type E3 ubiquitin transferase n=1 Tax=Tolypocladium ophioglossoides (strain CBS 100239) TaxID=1163406 RepID=A0A0L0N211_TOLOC|nr:putative E3 ubiquitin-protein ligase ARI8 [Tolypocladium ophioglossoides CBS 100239]